MALRVAARCSAVFGVAAALFAGSEIHADLYRCEGKDGGVRYVGNPEACPGARRYEPRSRVQSVAPLPGAASAPRPSSERAPQRGSGNGSGDPGAASFWQRKKAHAEAELRQVDAAAPRLERMALRCNKGADAWYTDRAGLKHGVSCPQIGAERDRARAEQKRLRHYLEIGLAEECRRAGCLPGWVR